jgi:hypothetical protein
MNQTARANRWKWHLGLALVLVAMASAPVATLP